MTIRLYMPKRGTVTHGVLWGEKECQDGGRDSLGAGIKRCAAAAQAPGTLATQRNRLTQQPTSKTDTVQEGGKSEAKTNKWGGATTRHNNQQTEGRDKRQRRQLIGRGGRQTRNMTTNDQQGGNSSYHWTTAKSVLFAAMTDRP
jgi:hypothetical protein